MVAMPREKESLLHFPQTPKEKGKHKENVPLIQSSLRDVR